MIGDGGQVDQLRFFVQLSDASTGLKTRTLDHETLLGLGFGRWDFVTATVNRRTLNCCVS